MSDPKAGKASSAYRGVLKRLGMDSPMDLVLHFPLRYEDETRVTPIARVRAGLHCQLEGEVISSQIMFKPRRQLVATLRDTTGQIQLRWLNFYPSQREQMTPGKRWRVRGEVRSGYHTLEMIHPKVSTPAAPLATALTPVYPSVDGLSQKRIATAMAAALQETDLQDTIGDDFRDDLGLMPFEEAVHILHAPKPSENLQTLDDRTHRAWVRVKFDELLAQQLSLATARNARLQRRAPALAAPEEAQTLAQRLLAQLPFSLTGAQARCLQEIEEDLTRAHPMHRLLQGDVGSGKTIVAMLAALRAVDNGKQAAVMAPTEILASQLHQKFAQWSEMLGLTCVFLQGSMGARQKREALEHIASGEAHIVVGTQALIQQGVAFHDLGLAIVDEQHRFGVLQRLTLSQKAQETHPHQLSMSATPIPRTLAMTFFADLDVSVIDERPPGRTPVVTKLIQGSRRDDVIAGIYHAVQEGGQAYWVCPLIEESETLELQTATQAYEELTESLPGVRVGLVHGRLAADEKAEVMRAFVEHELDLLVTTTVIEVGVDVPNASLMVIEDAQRFGLAQLHQLRGRVGRGARASVCVLMYAYPLSQVARERLRAMYETDDGFEIAQRDLQLRGPGEFLGARQSGLALLRFADYEADAWWVEQARTLANTLLQNYPERVQAHLERWMPGREAYLSG